MTNPSAMKDEPFDYEAWIAENQTMVVVQGDDGRQPMLDVPTVRTLLSSLSLNQAGKAAEDGEVDVCPPALLVEQWGMKARSVLSGDLEQLLYVAGKSAEWALQSRPLPPQSPKAESGKCVCDCKPFCESHGRDEIATGEDGAEFCNECAADGFGGELCHPSAGQCDMTNPKINEWERGFMCPKHAAEHVIFCQEALKEDEDGHAPADQKAGNRRSYES